MGTSARPIKRKDLYVEAARGGGVERKKGVAENCEKIGARGVEVLCRASVCVEGCTCNFQTFGKCV